MNIKKVDTKFVRKSFTTEKTVLNYTKAVKEIGLWKSEKIMIKKFFNLENRILNIGCGAGRTTIGLYELGYHLVEGLDLSEAMIVQAKRISKEYELFWKEEKKKWALHLEDKSLHEFGDRVIKKEERDIFIHLPTREEVISSLEEAGFILIEGILRSELCEESEEVKNFSTDCVFWLVQKP